MSKKAVNLNDPDCEPTDEDWDELLNAVGKKVRAQTERMAKERKERANRSVEDDSED